MMHVVVGESVIKRIFTDLDLSIRLLFLLCNLYQSLAYSADDKLIICVYYFQEKGFALEGVSSVTDFITAYEESQ